MTRTLSHETMTWEMFDSACVKIAERVSAPAFDNIWGPPRGGWIVAARLSHLLDLPVCTGHPQTWTLVVDDIVDTGRTLYELSSRNIIATLYWAEGSLFTPNIWVYKRKAQWVDFPWERTFKVTQGDRSKNKLNEVDVRRLFSTMTKQSQIDLMNDLIDIFIGGESHQNT